jgi:hypothetical protein
LIDVLHVMRELADHTAALTPLQASELWQDTQSPHALAVLQRYTTALLLNSAAGSPRRPH